MSGQTRARSCPERTCVGCRSRGARHDLLRVALIGGECVPDPRGTLPGRGAYVHPVAACVDLAVRRKAFPRAFRVQGPLEVAAVREQVRHSTHLSPEAPRAEQQQAAR